METSTILMGLDRLAEHLQAKYNYTNLPEFSGTVMSMVSTDTNVPLLWKKIREMEKATGYDGDHENRYNKLFWQLKSKALFVSLVYWCSLNSPEQLDALLDSETDQKELAYLRARIGILDNMLGTAVAPIVSERKAKQKEVINKWSIFTLQGSKACMQRLGSDGICDNLTHTALIKRLKDYANKKYQILFHCSYSALHNTISQTVDVSLSKPFVVDTLKQVMPIEKYGNNNELKRAGVKIKMSTVSDKSAKTIKLVFKCHPFDDSIRQWLPEGHTEGISKAFNMWFRRNSAEFKPITFSYDKYIDCEESNVVEYITQKGA